MANGMITPHEIHWDTLLSDTTVSQTGEINLNGNISNYDILFISINNGIEYKYYPILPIQLTVPYDISWPATDSTSWYVLCTVNFVDNVKINIRQIKKSGFTTVKIGVHGGKII